jgi:hypothetical protein
MSEPGIPYAAPEPVSYGALPASALPEQTLTRVFGYAPDSATTSEGVIEVLSRLVNGLLHPASEGNLAERAAALVDGLLNLAEKLLGAAGAAGGAEGVSAPPTLKGLAAEMLRLVDGLLHPASGQDLTQRVAGLVANLLGLIDGLVGEGGTPGPVPEPSSPHAPAAPVPAPSFPTSISSNGSPTFSEGTASVLLLGVLASSLVILLRVGKHSWTSRAMFRPSSALRLAVERPG